MTSGIMLNEIIKKSLFITGADKIAKKVYIFGSFPHSSNPSDIDVLLIYNPAKLLDYKLVIKFREAFSSMCREKFNLSADVILLTEDEERQRRFAYSESAELVWRFE